MTAAVRVTNRRPNPGRPRADRQGWLAERIRSGHSTGEHGSAVLEFVFVALLAMLPLVYLLVAVAVVQRSELAVASAARDAGRAAATGDPGTDLSTRVDAAVRLALAAQGLPDDAQVRFVAAASPCSSAAVIADLAPGGEFTVCVTRRVSVPAVPSIVAGRGVTTTGRFTVRVDDFRAAASGGDR